MNGSEPVAAPKMRRSARFLDALALLIISLAVWKFVVQPLIFPARMKAVVAPHVRLPLMGGGTFDLAHARGHVVFLDFWASWCEPCKESIPLVQGYKAEHPQALVYSIDAGESVSTATEYARRKGMRDVAFDPDLKIADRFGVDGFPTMIVIGRDGKEHARWSGFNPLIRTDMSRAAREY